MPHNRNNRDRSRFPERRPSRPRRAIDGIVAKTQSGQFGQTWWASRWLRALEALVAPARLSRGRSYARTGQVLTLDIKPGRVDARVQGSRPAPYKVVIEIAPLSEHAWQAVTDAMSGQALFAAKLLASEMPQDIEQAFATAGVALFPRTTNELKTECSCPDWANPCKHVAAVFYLLGEQFDEDPFLMFRLRGRSQEDMIAALRQRRAAQAVAAAGPDAQDAPVEAAPVEAAPTPVPPLAKDLDHFWVLGPDFDELRADPVPPKVLAAFAKRLGQPPFWPKGTGAPDWELTMTDFYLAATAEALRVAFASES